MARKKQKFLVLPDGTEEKVLKETSKYFVCKDMMMRKSNKDIVVKFREPEQKNEGGDE